MANLVRLTRLCIKCNEEVYIIDVGVSITDTVYLLWTRWACPKCNEELEASQTFEELCVQAAKLYGEKDEKEPTIEDVLTTSEDDGTVH